MELRDIKLILFSQLLTSVGCLMYFHPILLFLALYIFLAGRLSFYLYKYCYDFKGWNNPGIYISFLFPFFGQLMALVIETDAVKKGFENDCAKINKFLFRNKKLKFQSPVVLVENK